MPATASGPDADFDPTGSFNPAATDAPAVFIGVRHHSPACAWLVRETIRALRPAYVLVEGPADMNARLDELLLEHRLPVAVFSHYRDEERIATSWAPLCDYSPEWIALREGRAAGAEVRFIDLPAWHPAFAGSPDRYANRYADAEARYAEATGRLCAHFSVDSVDALWDGLFEVADVTGPDALRERLDTYFELVRGDTEADPGDRAREEYMASWVKAAVSDAGGRPVLVVTGGFHQPALRALVSGGGSANWPSAPRRCTGTVGDRQGVPASREGALDDEAEVPVPRAGISDDRPAIPNPREGAPAGRPGVPNPPAGTSGTRSQAPAPPAGTPADWPEVPAPPDGALGGSFLVPYSFRQLDAFAGYQSGMPSPGYYQHLWETGPQAAAQRLLRAVTERLRGRGRAVSTAGLVAARGLSQGLALLRGHPYETRVDVLDGLAGALIADDLDQPLPWTTRGTLGPGSHPVVVEMVAACAGDVEGRLHPDTPLPPLVHDVTERLARLGLAGADAPVTLDLTDPDGLSRSRVLHRLRVLGIPGFTRASGPAHGADPVFTERWEPGTTHGREAALIEAGAYGAQLDEAAGVVLGEQVRAAGADVGPLAGLLFDAVLCGVGPLCADLLDTLAAQVGQVPELGPLGEVLTTTLGLWRHDRVFGVAREEVVRGTDAKATGGTGGETLVDVLDGIVSALTEDDFLTGLPALRQAFAFFPPRERERIAERLLERRGAHGSARSLLRTTADPLLLARARALEDTVARLLDRHGLGTAG